MTFLRHLTARGRSVVAMAVGSLIFGRILALRELYMMTAAFTALVAFAYWIARRRGELEVKRTAVPPKTTAGGDIRVDLTVSNVSEVNVGPTLFQDALPESLNVSARLALPSIPANSERKMAYVLKTRVRGKYALGPLEAVRTDPFGLVQRRKEISGTSTIIVYPAFDRLQTMPRELQRVGAVRHSPLLGQGDEFYALRAYVIGDDMRRVHWPSSMKRGEILVRQQELVREPGCLIILDTCKVKHRGKGAGASIEAAISACASVATLALSYRMPVEIFTAEGRLLHSRAPREEDILEALAILNASEAPNVTNGVADAVRTGSVGASVICITPGLAGPELSAVSSLAARASAGATIFIAAETFGEGGAPGGNPAMGLPVLRLEARASFRALWEGAVRAVAAGIRR